MKSTEDLLIRAQDEDLDSETRNMVRKLAQSGQVCKIHVPKPRRFNLTIGTSDLRFHNVVQVDTIFLHNRPVSPSCISIPYCATDTLAQLFARICSIHGGIDPGIIQQKIYSSV